MIPSSALLSEQSIGQEATTCSTDFHVRARSSVQNFQVPPIVGPPRKTPLCRTLAANAGKSIKLAPSVRKQGDPVDVPDNLPPFVIFLVVSATCRRARGLGSSHPAVQASDYRCSPGKEISKSAEESKCNDRWTEKTGQLTEMQKLLRVSMNRSKGIDRPKLIIKNRGRKRK